MTFVTTCLQNGIIHVAHLKLLQRKQSNFKHVQEQVQLIPISSIFYRNTVQTCVTKWPAPRENVSCWTRLRKQCWAFGNASEIVSSRRRHRRLTRRESIVVKTVFRWRRVGKLSWRALDTAGEIVPCRGSWKEWSPHRPSPKPHSAKATCIFLVAPYSARS